MRLFSALLRLCLLYFVFTADKGFGKTADLSFSSSSVFQEKTTTNGIELDTDSEDVLTVVPFRDHMEKENILRKKRSEDSVEDAPSKDEGSPCQRLASVLWSVIGERDQLKETLEAEIARLKEELWSQQGLHPQPRGSYPHHDRYYHPHGQEGRSQIPKCDTCPCTSEMATALSQFQGEQKLLLQGVAESISFLERDLMILLNHDALEGNETQKIMHNNDTQPQNITKEEEERLKLSNCNELFESGKKESGVYTIYPRRGEDEEEGVKVWCDMGEQYKEDGEGVTEEERGGGGWTVILQRKPLDQQVNFIRGWDDYKEGFGDPKTEYWIGNEIIHQLTSGGNPQQALRIDMEDWDGVRKFAFYGNFSVGGEKDSFPLHVGAFSSNRSTVNGDSLNHVTASGDYILNGMKFSTFDKDNDEYSTGNCALCCGGGGGFWYNVCSDVKPTRPLLPKGQSGDGMWWFHFNNDYTHLQSLSMKIKPLHG